MPSSVREFPRLDLHYEIKTPSGRFYRWAKDEPDAENVPSGSGFTTTDHGGFDSQNLTLPRKPGVEYADLTRLSNVRALGAGGEVACETRLKEAPRTSGDQIAVSPAAEGWIAHLEDDQTAAEIYINRDLGEWTGPSVERRVELEAANAPNQNDPQVITSLTGIPALQLEVSGVWVSPITPRCEAFFGVGSRIPVGRLITNFKAGVEVASNANFVLDTWVGAEHLGDLYAGVDGSVDYTAASTSQTSILFTWFYDGTPAGGDGYSYQIQLSNLIVIGVHRLPLQGAFPAVGFLGSDVLANALPRWAPLLNFSTGPSGSIRPGIFVIPHLSFKEQTTTLAILEAVNRFELRPYMVYEDRTFYWQEWGERSKWRARVAPTQLSETGPSTSRLRNGVLLKWSDVDETSKSAGPLGSGCDIESAELEDKDPENPANQLGTPFWGSPYDLGIVTVDSEAIRIGVLLQARLKEVDRSGQAQIVGVCEDDKGVLRPAWQVRAGDTIVFIDASDTSERRIIATQYDDDSKTNTITLDAPPEGVPDLLAQLGVGNTELGV